MAKPEWGTKRQCSSCGSRFYDLSKTPIVCPKCGAAYEGEVTFKSRRSSSSAESKVSQPVKAETVIDLDDDTLIVLDEDDEIDGASDVAEEEDEFLDEGDFDEDVTGADGEEVEEEAAGGGIGGKAGSEDEGRQDEDNDDGDDADESP